MLKRAMLFVYKASLKEWALFTKLKQLPNNPNDYNVPKRFLPSISPNLFFSKPLFALLQDGI